MAVSWTFPPPGHRGGAGNFPFLDNPFLVFALRRQFDRLQCMMSDSAFQQFAALARNLQLAREAGLLAGDRIRVYLRSPAEETTAKRGLARIIPIADDAMAKTAKAASGSAGPPKPALPAKAIAAKAGTETAKLLKDPLGQIVKEIQDKIPTLEAAAKTEDLGVKAAKNLVERAKVGVDLLKTVAADKATSTATAASPAIQAFTGPDAKALIATATALTLAAAAGATVYLYKQGRLNGDALEAYRETLEGYSRQLADTLVTYKSSLGTTLEGYKTGLESTLGRTKERVTAYISSLRNVAPESDSGVSMPEMVQVPPSEQSASSPSHASDAGGEFDDYSAGASSVVSLPSSETPLDEPEREELGLKKLMIRDGDDLSAGCLTPGGQLSPALPPSEHGEGDVPAAMGMSAISTSSSEGRSVEDWIIVKEQGKHEEQVQESENVPSEAELAKVDQ